MLGVHHLISSFKYNIDTDQQTVIILQHKFDDWNVKSLVTSILMDLMKSHSSCSGQYHQNTIVL